MKRLSLFVLAISLACGAAAQDLHSTSFVDQLNVGKRGNDQGTKVIEGNAEATSWGPAATNGADFVEYNGADLTISGASTAVKYVNTWGTHGGDAIESPIVDITLSNVTNPDRGSAMAAKPANTRPNATGPNTAILIGDDGGYNALFFGESNDRNYYAQVDMWFPGASASVTGSEEAGLVSRAARDDVDQAIPREDYSYSPYLDAGYAIYYEYQTKSVKTVINLAGDPTETVLTEVPNVAAGWHTLRIENVSDTIKFFLDGVQVGPNLVDTTANIGRPGIYYAETGVLSASELQGTFDNLRAGPLVASDIGHWSLY